MGDTPDNWPGYRTTPPEKAKSGPKGELPRELSRYGYRTQPDQGASVPPPPAAPLPSPLPAPAFDWLAGIEEERAAIVREAHEPLIYDRPPVPLPGLLDRIPQSVQQRLRVRALAAGFVTPHGAVDFDRLLNHRLLLAGNGVVTVVVVERVVRDGSDPDMQILAREVVRGILLADGYPDAAAKLDGL